jgi:hypothetical protein
LLKHLRVLRPDLKVYAYDNDPEMAKNATKEVPILMRWEQVGDKLLDAKAPTLVISSVLHEVMHYGSRKDIGEFWDKVLNSGFKFIVIRDMVPSRGIDRTANINDIKKVYHKFHGTKALNDFERAWGSIENNRNLVHFLLKYRYLEPNWEREVRENYIPVTREELLAKVPGEYDVLFHEHYVLPYIWTTVKTDMGIELKDPTHLKLILVKNN